MSTQIPTLPAAPAATDPVDDFDAKAFDFNAALGPWAEAANALGQEMQINADVAAALINAMSLPQFQGTSSTSLAIGTGTKSFTTQTGKGWIAGQIVVASNGGSYMKGAVAAYNSGTGALDLTVTSVNGSGTFNSWTLGLSYDGLALVNKGPITASGLTQATARMLGRSTAGTGAVEEISLASTLELLAGFLGVKDGSITPAKLSKPPTLGTAVPTTSGTAIDITGISSGMDEITYSLNAVSTSGSNNLIFQLGAGSIDATAYTGGYAYLPNGAAIQGATLSTAFFLAVNIAAASSIHGLVKLTRVSGNTWAASWVISLSGAAVVIVGSGTKTLSGALDRVRLTTVGATDTFDAGSVNTFGV